MGKIHFEYKNKKIQKIEIKFSHNSKYLAIFIIDLGLLRIFEISDYNIE
jgi:hypothetical protein